MSEESGSQPPVADSWDVYWRGTHENAAHQEGGPQEAALNRYWGELFAARRALNPSGSVLDLASGNGAVSGHARELAPQMTGFCLDYSTSALLELRKRHPGSFCVAGNARHLPFADGSFEMVASQFGLEYAGSGTAVEAGRVLTPGGKLAAILHYHDGAIYRECAQNLQAVDDIRASRLLPLARDAFNAGFDLNAGIGSPDDFRAAEKCFTPAVRSLEQLMRNMGEAIASGLPRKLYQDIAHMYRRMSAYDRKDIIDWVDGMMMQLDAYGGRMQSMLDAALDEAALRLMCELLERQGLAITRCDPMRMVAGAEPAAWVLEADRPG